MFWLMARLGSDARKETAPVINAAFRSAQRAMNLEQKEIAALMDNMDEAQLRRQLSGLETFDLARLVIAALRGGDVGAEFMGHFSGALVDQVGGFRPLMLRALSAVFEPLLASPRPVMVKATLASSKGVRVA